MKQITDLHYNPSKTHRAVLTSELVVDLGEGHVGYHEFCHDGNLWGILNNDRLAIMAGYASDLCSPGFYLFGKWYGTPSKGAELAAFIHDFTRQFIRPNVECSPWTRKDTDRIFYNALKMTRFKGRDIYHGAVSGFLGSFWTWINRPRHDVYCRCIHRTKP